jgi:hypothetical protein
MSSVMSLSLLGKLHIADHGINQSLDPLLVNLTIMIFILIADLGSLVQTRHLYSQSHLWMKFGGAGPLPTHSNPGC